MLADPARIDDLAVHLQAENLRRARFKSGDIPTSDALLRALPAITARLLTSLRPDIDFRVLDGPGHWAIYEAPDQATALRWTFSAQRDTPKRPRTPRNLPTYPSRYHLPGPASVV